MSDQTMLAMVGGGLFSSLFVVPMGRTWVFIAFASALLGFRGFTNT